MDNSVALFLFFITLTRVVLCKEAEARGLVSWHVAHEANELQVVKF